jgi:hypothetical protein
MNRRTFLKLTGATAILIATPLIAKPEPKWIRLSDSVPQPGQKIILCSMDRAGMYGGMVHGGEYAGHRDDAEAVTIQMAHDFSAYIVRFKNGPNIIEQSHCFIYTPEGKEVLETREWLEHVQEEDRMMTFWGRPPVSQARHDRKNYVWLPVNGEYPTTLPKIPK